MAQATCEIQWIDDYGNPTPDDNPSIGQVRTVDRHQEIGGRMVHFRASEWFHICDKHAKQMTEPGMDIWEWKK